MVHDAQVLQEESDVEVSEPMFFDATPEGSVIFDWDFPPEHAGVEYLPIPVHTEPASSSRVAQTGRGKDCENETGSKKTRPPKLVREVRDLQEYVKQLGEVVKSKADNASVQTVLDRETDQKDLQQVLEQKVNQQDFRLLSDSVGQAVTHATLDERLQHTVSNQAFQEAINEKVSKEHFRQLRHRVKNTVDVAFGAALQEGLEQKASCRDLERLRYNVDGKADRASVQAALAQKVSRNVLKCRMVSCGALWAFSATCFAIVFGLMFYSLLRQQQQIQQLSGTVEQLIVHNHKLNGTFEQLTTVNHMIKQLSAPEASVSHLIDTSLGSTDDGLQLDVDGKVLAHNQVFKSSKVQEDTHTVALVPPFKNAWLIVDASLRNHGVVCAGKADLILRIEQRIFSFYAPPAIEHTSATTTAAALAPNVAAAATESPQIAGVAPTVVAATTTTTTTTPKACMIMTTALKEQHGGAVIVLLNFKRDPDSIHDVNSSRIFNISGKIQWFPQ